jgi:hypothetical protein
VHHRFVRRQKLKLALEVVAVGAAQLCGPFHFPTCIFIERDGVIQSIVLKVMDTAQVIAEASRLFRKSPTAAEIDVSS